MFIQTEQTPNPQTLKFLPGKVIMEEGCLSLPEQYAHIERPTYGPTFIYYKKTLS